MKLRGDLLGCIAFKLYADAFDEYKRRLEQ